MSKKILSVVLFVSIGIGACAKVTTVSGPAAQPQPLAVQTEAAAAPSAHDIQEAQLARQQGPAAITPPATQAVVAAVNSGKISIKGKARIAALYYLDQPAHREVVLNWFKANHAKDIFESQKFGYVDAILDWKDVGNLIATAGSLGLNEASLMKLDLEDVAPEDADMKTHSPNAAALPSRAQPENTGGDSSFRGAVHSAGFGANVESFRRYLSNEFKKDPSAFEGQGSKVAIFDAGLDLSRTDVFQNRIADFIIGEPTLWRDATETLADFQKQEPGAEALAGLDDAKNLQSLRFVTLDEAEFQDPTTDLNGSGAIDKITVAVYEKDGHWEARVRPLKGLPFGDAVMDFGLAHKTGNPQIINLFTGKYYVRAATNPSKSAMGVRFRDVTGGVQVAFVGLYPGADHGISNLHMVGGNYVDGAHKIHYRGVAPQVEFLAVQPWKLPDPNGDYGAKWIPLARGVIKSADAGADVLDLDIATPGVRSGTDLLSELFCRVTAKTNTVPVVAAHNYGPNPYTVQNMAQGRCVLGIGAAHSAAALQNGYHKGTLDPKLIHDYDLQTASYSGRGFGMNGMYKPDIISPAYGYTAYGSQFIRFGGTSGATPTTAGIIALLKQAARMTGIELNFDQVKFLLQSSADPVDSSHLRDGYGFTNLLNAWKLFEELHPAPLRLSGVQPYFFDGRPNVSQISLSLLRNSVPGSINTATPMKLWIEFGGDHPEARHWLKFNNLDQYQEQPSETLDMPMQGEVQTLSLSIDLSDDAWNALPAGDYVAVVKGVRAGIADAKGRRVDFLMPIAFTKGIDVGTSSIQLKPMYADQYQILPIATHPGDELLLYSDLRCNGQPFPNSVDGSNQDALFLQIDNEASYQNSSMMMSSYNAMALLQGPVRIRAERSLVNIAVVRYRAVKCDGTVDGTITVRRTGLGLTENAPSYTVADGKIQIAGSIDVKMTANSLNEAELYRGGVWNLDSGKSTLILSRKVNDDFSFVAPSGVQEVRVIPDSNAHAQALLINRSSDDKIVDYEAGEEDGLIDCSGGLGNLDYFFQGQFFGLKLEKPKAKSTVIFQPAAAKLFTGTLQILMDAPADFVMSASAPIKTLNQGQSMSMNYSGSAPAVVPDSLKDFASSDWSYRLNTPISLKEANANSNSNAKYVSPDLWSGSIDVSLPVR